MNLNTVILIALVLLSKSGLAKKQHVSDTSLVGTYSFSNAQGLAGIILDLKDDATFEYKIGTDISMSHSQGKWIRRQDTLILSASIEKADIPIQVREDIVDTVGDLIMFSVVNNLDNDVMAALLAFNGDTTTLCDPVLEFKCDMIKIGALDSIQVKFGNYSSSRWNRISNKKANKISVTVLSHDLLDRYIFLVDEKFLIGKDGLYPLKGEKVTVDMDSKGEIIKRKVVLKKGIRQ